MAWGARSNLGIDDLVSRVASDEANLTALALLPSRRFGPAEAAALAGALRSNTRLAELHLGGRAMSAESASLLAEALIERSRKAAEATAATAAASAAASPLRALSVGDASFGCAGAAALSPLLSHAGALCGELDLEFRGIGLEGAKALASAVVEARRRSHREAAAKGVGAAAAPPAPPPPLPLFLQSLNLARNPSLGGGGDPRACEALSAALFDGVLEGEEEAAVVLTCLDLSGCALSSAGVAALVRERGRAAAEPSSSSPSPSPLLSLRLERNSALCPLAATALARALAPRAEGGGGEGGGEGAGGGGQLANLRHLSLRGCPRLGDAAAEALARAFLSFSLLRPSDDAAAFSPAPPPEAARPSALRSLDLSGCGVGPAGAARLAAALASKGGCCRLETLKLSGTSGGGGGGEGEEENGEAEPEAAAGSPATVSAALGDEGALSLARALASSASCSLSELDLSSCGISSGEAAAALIEGGGGGGRLQSLTLAGNPLGDAGARAIADALLRTRLRLSRKEGASGGDRLQHLDLAACGIGLEGATALAEALLTTTTAATGGAGEPAAVHVAAPSLRTLVLGGNPATEADAFADRVVARLREDRPELDVAWRSGDQHAAAAEGKK